MLGNSGSATSAVPLGEQAGSRGLLSWYWGGSPGAILSRTVAASPSGVFSTLFLGIQPFALLLPLKQI